MTKAAADTLLSSRQNLHGLVKDLSQEQWFKQPEGFANNIAWNIGHLVMAQQGLVYARLGLQANFPKGATAMYSPGTSPADWESQPNTDELLQQFMDNAQKMADDVDAGMFDDLELPEESPIPGIMPAQSVEHAMLFNQHHEGMHLGVITSLIDNV